MSDKEELENKAYEAGYRAAMLAAADVARELYVNHCHHHGANGLLDRCKEAEQVFLSTRAEQEKV